MRQPIRVLLAEKDPILRTALRAKTESASDMAVVAEAAEVRAVILKTIVCQPDILLLDLALPKQAVAEFIQRIRSTAPNTRVIILAEQWPQHFHKATPVIQAAGYLLKSASVAEWLMAIRIIHHGGTVIPFALTHPGSPHSQPNPVHGLTATAHGFSTWQFSARLRQILPGAPR